MFAFERLIHAAAGGESPGYATARLLVRPPRKSDFDEWAKLRRESRGFLRPWEPRWTPDHVTERNFRRRVAWSAQELAADRSYPFLIFHVSGAQMTLVGGITLEHVRRGAAQSAALGYWLGKEHTGHGFMSEAVGGIIGFATKTLELSRLEAACLPENKPSRRLLERCGFFEEAHLKNYLQINGAWRDHLLYSRLLMDRSPTS